MKKRFTLLVSLVLVVAMATPALAAQSSMTRLDFTKKMAAALELELGTAESVFSDVSEKDAGVVASAVYHGILSGYEDQTFKPGKIITTEEACVMIAQAFEVSPAAASLDALRFTDKEDIASWAVPHIVALVECGALANDEDVLLPKAPISEAEIDRLIGAFIEGYTGAVTTPVVTFDPSITKEGLTAFKMMEAASDLLNSADTYKMDASWNISVSVLGDAVDMKAEQHGVYKNPDQVYLTQTMFDDVSEIVMEIYVNGDKMYMRMDSEADFEEIDLGMNIAQMNNMMSGTDFTGIAIGDPDSFSQYVYYKDDRTMNGKDYYVVSASIGQAATDQYIKPLVKSVIDEYMNILLSAYTAEGLELTAEDEEMITAMIDSMIDSLTLTVSFDVCIEKETKLTSAYYYDMDMGMTIAIPDEAADLTIPMNMKMDGTMNVYDYNVEVTFPEV